MNTSRCCAASLLFTALVGVTPVGAADRTETVKFKSGASSTTVKGGVKGYDLVEYNLVARAGQTMSVALKPSNLACYFNVVAPGGKSAMYIGSIHGNEFTGTLPANGDYRVEVYLMRSAARRKETCRYTMSIKISG